MQEPTDKTRTYSYSLYPDDAAVVEEVAAKQFRYNTSEAMRHIIREYNDRRAVEENKTTQVNR